MGIQRFNFSHRKSSLPFSPRRIIDMTPVPPQNAALSLLIIIIIFVNRHHLSPTRSLNSLDSWRCLGVGLPPSVANILLPIRP